MPNAEHSLQNSNKPCFQWHFAGQIFIRHRFQNKKGCLLKYDSIQTPAALREGEANVQDEKDCEISGGRLRGWVSF